MLNRLAACQWQSTVYVCARWIWNVQKNWGNYL